MNLRRILIIFILMALIAINHNPGAKANRPGPGTTQDPLVTKSYADQTIKKAFGQLAEEIGYMKTQVKLMQQRAEALGPPLREPVTLTLGKREATIGAETQLLTTPPYTKDGRTMLPFRFVGEILGAAVTWQGETKTATYQLQNKKIELTIGSKYATINSQPINLDLPAELKNGSTMVPARFIAENLGANIDWQPATQQVIIQP